MNNLAVALEGLGDLAGARVLQAESVMISRRVLGDDHPNTLASMNNLALTLESLGDLQGARSLHEQTLAIFRSVLGDEHADTLGSMNNLALTLERLGDLPGARSLHEQTLEIRRRVLGGDHPDTLGSMNNVASTLERLGDLPGARSLHEQTLEIRRRVLGDEHPATLTSIENLAATLNGQGDHVGARTLHGETLAIRRRVLSVRGLAFGDARESHRTGGFRPPASPKGGRLNGLTDASEAIAEFRLGDLYHADRDYAQPLVHLCRSHDSGRALGGRAEHVSDEEFGLIQIGLSLAKAKSFAEIGAVMRSLTWYFRAWRDLLELASPDRALSAAIVAVEEQLDQLKHRAPQPGEPGVDEVLGRVLDRMSDHKLDPAHRELGSHILEQVRHLLAVITSGHR